jgi:hypothetical protein
VIVDFLIGWAAAFVVLGVGALIGVLPTLAEVVLCTAAFLACYYSQVWFGK